VKFSHVWLVNFMNLKTGNINFWQMFISGFPLKFLNDIEKYVQICCMLPHYMLLSWKKWKVYVGMCTNNFSFGKLQVLLNISFSVSTFWFVTERWNFKDTWARKEASWGETEITSSSKKSAWPTTKTKISIMITGYS